MGEDKKVFYNKNGAKKERIDWITGLKGWCCVTVVMLHLLASFYAGILQARKDTGYGGYNYISLTPINIFFNGSFSVYIFWTISAFLIAHDWYNLHSSENMTRKILNKYFRTILPIIVCSLLVFILIKAGLYFNVAAGDIIGPSFFINERDYSNITFNTFWNDIALSVFFKGQVMLIPPLWTMQTEFYGSCMTVLLRLD